MISYSAPAKVILSGEHSVVFAKPAIVSAIDLRLTFEISSSNKYISNKKINTISDIVYKYVSKKGLCKKKPPYNYKIQSQIPIGGLGSSAALCVASCAGFYEFYTKTAAEKEIVNNLAYQAEKIFHANPSGVDTTTSCFGGLIFFRKEFEFLKTIFQLPFKIPSVIQDNLYLIDSGRPVESTAEMVGCVGCFFNKNPKKCKEVFNELEITTKHLIISIVKKDVRLFSQSLTKNQILLESIGVVSGSTKNLISKLSKFGYGKISGAGGKKNGSGYILFYTDNIRETKEYCKKNNISYFKFNQSYEGYKKEI